MRSIISISAIQKSYATFFSCLLLRTKRQKRKRKIEQKATLQFKEIPIYYKPVKDFLIAICSSAIRQLTTNNQRSVINIFSTVKLSTAS
jgi:hypothetical protein